ncbi:MAG TPA: MerR family transcriptional regulator [Micromonosporaceae bacterium]|nr:MerR family transcriptional regulator [Micromonosporaceae bacterium]
MRISDLSKQTGVPVATIKFYLRERLLPAGRPTGRNQAEYSEAHVRRLRLIRALANIGQFELSVVREVLAAVENEELPMRDLYEVINRALVPPEPATTEADGLDQAGAEVTRFIAALGWQVAEDSPSRVRLAHVVAALERLGCACGIDFFLPYAETAERIAAQELDLLPPDRTRGGRAGAVVRAVLFDIALAAMRRMAQQHYVALRFGAARDRDE